MKKKLIVTILCIALAAASGCRNSSNNASNISGIYSEKENDSQSSPNKVSKSQDVDSTDNKVSNNSIQSDGEDEPISIPSTNSDSTFIQMSCNNFVNTYADALSVLVDLYFVKDFSSDGYNFHEYQVDAYASMDGCIVDINYDSSDIMQSVSVRSPIGTTTYFYVYNAIASVNPDANCEDIMTSLGVTEDGIREDGVSYANFDWGNLVFEQKDSMSFFTIMFY